MSGLDLLAGTRPLAGRYRVVTRIGAGTAGTVYRAEDLATGTVVAIKVLASAAPVRVARLEREARVLRELGIPGVVRLLDEGTHDGHPFLVMRFVDGAPFPGPVTGGWARLADQVVRLLEILARVHEAGVLHRDLKPTNVLVDAKGAPTVLDFGLARFVEGTTGLTRTGDVLGTPRYQAPEQVLCDRPVDARADLYAVGVMIFEVLAGRSPQPAHSLGGIYSARLVRDPPPLLSVAPDVPPTVARIVDRLVARAPEDRPGSARDVLDSLAGAAPTRPAGHLPWLGPRTSIARVVDAAHAGRAVLLTGPRGAGRSRLLTEVEQELRARGHGVVRVPPGERPFESLLLALGGIDLADGDIGTALVAALRRRLDGGDVLIVDDADRIDAWTMGLLDAAEGAVIRGTATEGAAPGGHEGPSVHLGTLHPSDVAVLFAESTPFAGALLHERTAGLPSRLAAEVGAWIAAGHARWMGDTLLVPDEEIELVAMGPPPDVRLGRRAAPNDLPAPLREALRWIALAEPGATVNLLGAARGRPTWEIEAEADALVRRGDAFRQEDGTLRCGVDRASFDAGDGVARAEAVAALAGATPPGTAGRLGRLLAAEAWAEAAFEAARSAEASLREGGFAAALAAARWGLRAAAASDEPIAPSPLLACLVRAARAVGTVPSLEHALAEVRRAERLAPHRRPSGAPSADIPSDWDTARSGLVDALHEIREGADDTPIAPAPDAAERLASALGRGADAVEVWALRLEHAEALLHAGADVHAEADALDRFAARHRLPLHGGYARWLRRAAAYRSGEVIVPDLRFVARVRALGVTRLVTRVCLVEAAAGWRSSRRDDAAQLALLAAAGPARGRVALLARAVGLACADGVGRGAGEALVADADSHPDPAVGLQVRGFVALALPDLATGLLDEVGDLAARVGRWSEILDILSGAEAIAFCRASAKRGRPSGPRTG